MTQTLVFTSSVHLRRDELLREAEQYRRAAGHRAVAAIPPRGGPRRARLALGRA